MVLESGPVQRAQGAVVTTQKRSSTPRSPEEAIERVAAGISQDDALMLRRAAQACRNVQQQGAGSTEWFSWVPIYLEAMADRAAKEATQE